MQSTAIKKARQRKGKTTTMVTESAPEDLNDSILPSQYNDLTRRRSPVAEGKYRLLWAVLEAQSGPTWRTGNVPIRSSKKV